MFQVLNVNQEQMVLFGVLILFIIILAISLSYSVIKRMESIKLVKENTDKKQLEEQLLVSEQSYRSLFNNHPDAVFSLDLEGNFKEINHACEIQFGFSHSQLMGLNVREIIHPDHLTEFVKVFELTSRNGVIQDVCIQAIQKNGTIINSETKLLPILLKNELVGVYGISKDVTEQEERKKVIKFMAYHDQLTGLPNRNKLNKYVKEKEVTKSESFAVLFFDLDRFKVINDTLGHSMGDQLLKEVAHRTKLIVNDAGMVFRQGGDEFIVLLENADRDKAAHIAQCIIDVLAQPFHISNYEIFTTPSIGISMYPEDGQTIETIVKNADFAMYQAKKAGKNTYRFYYLDEGNAQLNPLLLEMYLHKALERNELELYYQPKMNLKTGRMIGTEALMRWNSPELGMVPPNLFIPIAEETGLIIQMGEWALKTACLQNKHWHDKGHTEMIVSVNLSPRQFAQSNIVNIISNTLVETKLKPEFLELEITESMTADIERSIVTLGELKALGVKISIDDFGTGFSSLNYLKEFPINTLKIDQSFVRNLNQNPNDETIVKTIISMAHSLNLSVIAEGIESKEQLIFLQQHFCEGGQGYLFGKPVPSEELEGMLKEIGGAVSKLGLPQTTSGAEWSEELVRSAKRELQETIRRQQGMTFKVKKINGHFIHTLCDGELVYRLGFIPQQVIGKDLFEIHPLKMAEEITTYYERAWHGEDRVSYEQEINAITYLVVLSPVKRGGIVDEVIGSCVDITDRKKMERHLKESEKRYRLIAENMPDLFFICSVSGRIDYASPSFEWIMGSQFHLEGQLFTELVGPENQNHFLKLFNESYMNKAPCQSEFQLEKQNKELGIFELVISPVFDEDKKVVQMLVIGRDITDKKKTEEMLLQSEKLSIVSELAAGVAHEIRNPVTSIKGFVQLLEESYDHTYFPIIKGELEQIEEIINEYLALANLQSLLIQRVDITELLQEVLDRFTDKLIEKSIRYSIESNLVASMHGDFNQLKKVFTNIIENSIEAVETYGEIWIKLTSNDSHINISITDNGIGMDEERLARLGEPYYSYREKGIGIGLMKCFQIIGQHKGTITFSSKEYEGTVVEVNIPRIKEENKGKGTRNMPTTGNNSEKLEKLIEKV
ncbi:EAL domain-containing protein [Bacillus salitolerans]|uniref:histidine kinase n=1 Tax=Bacillus salitolerans TaxID=1437434 RepID=A0ABW4LTC4_9BACI